MTIFHQLGAFLADHWQAISATLGVAAVAFICTMPADIPWPLPQKLQPWWTWLRNGLQTAVPAARHNENPPRPMAQFPSMWQIGPQTIETFNENSPGVFRPEPVTVTAPEPPPPQPPKQETP